MGKERSVFKNLLRRYGTIPNFNIADLPEITPEQNAAREAYKLEVVIQELFGAGGRYIRCSLSRVLSSTTFTLIGRTQHNQSDRRKGKGRKGNGRRAGTIEGRGGLCPRCECASPYHVATSLVPDTGGREESCQKNGQKDSC